jgi:Flp pilus assembly protein TadD
MALDLLARAAVGAGNHEAAIGALRRLAARRPDDAALLRKLARVCEASGNLIAALDAERRLAALGDPEAANRASRLVTAIAREARQGLDRGDLADAYDALVALRSVEADHPQTADLVQRFTARQLRRAHEARRARLHAEVAAAAERILALNPDHTRALALLASARHGLRDFAAAADLFRRVACAEPDNEAAWIGLARAEHRAGHPDAARAAAMEVRRLVPGDPTALAILGALATEAATIAQDTAAAVDLRLGETVIPSIDAVAPVVDKPKRKGGRRKRKA